MKGKYLEEINQQQVINAIKKKLLGKTLNYKEIYVIMDSIAKKKLSDILTTYFAASGYSKGFNAEELYHLTKAMVSTGERLHFEGIVADKHSIGGVPGTRTTLIVVPIVAACGFTIPKSSSRAITTPDGTADDMEILAPVTLSKEKIYKVVRKTNGCIVWGGSVRVAPADDSIINVEKPLFFESFDKIIVSILAKKIAFGANHVVIDLPYGNLVKVQKLEDAKVLKGKFEHLAKRFHIKIRVLIHRTDQPAGRGVGPVLETREALRVLEQKTDRPLDLEIRALDLAANLLEICLEDSPQTLRTYVKENFGNCFGWATTILEEGFAFEKMQEIIKAQGGNPNVDANSLKPGNCVFEKRAKKNGSVKGINSKNLTIVAKLLGAPAEKGAGIFLNKKIGEKYSKHDTIYTLYSEDAKKLSEGKEAVETFPIERS